MPVWWRWYFWICPVSWTLYGLVTSQFGDIKERIDTGETVEEFVRSYFGYRAMDGDFILVLLSNHCTSRSCKESSCSK